MKKLFSLILFSVIALTSFAQTEADRLLVTSKQGDVKGFITSRIDSVWFAKVDGKVAADVSFLRYATGATGDTVWVNVKRTPSCEAFKITVVPTVLADQLASDAIVESYFNQRTTSGFFYEDFSEGQMTGFETAFKPDTKYTVLTLGYDKYGVACSASRAPFTTPATPVVGHPTVTYTVDDVKQQQFTITFTANDDCPAFYTCSFVKGEAQKQFEQWGPMMGFANMGDMIKQFSGGAHTGVYTNTWKDMTPGTSYEVYVQPVDANGTYGDMVIVPVTTSNYGGDGLAEMSIEVGSFGGEAGAYWQEVTYTPNDQAAMHRDIIITKEAYDKADMGEKGVTDYLKADNPMDPYWNQYGVDVARWNADPSTSYVACSIAQNAQGQWGPLTTKAFTTPAAPNAVAKKAPAVAKRMTKGTSTGTAGRLLPQGVKLVKTK